MARKSRAVTVVETTRAELDKAGAASTPLGAVALALAERIDDPATRAAGAAKAAETLRATLDAIAERAPAKGDGVDDLKARRDARRRGA